MTFALNDAEWSVLVSLPDDDVVELAAELGILLPAPPFSVRALLDRCVPAMLSLAKQDGGLPFSRYDLDDLRELPPAHHQALAVVQGLAAGSPSEALVRVGERIHKARSRRKGKRDGHAFMVPILLVPLARHAAGG